MVETSRIDLIDELSRLEVQLKNEGKLRTEISDVVHRLRNADHDSLLQPATVDPKALRAVVESIENELQLIEIKNEKSKKFAQLRAFLAASISLASGMFGAIAADTAATFGPRFVLLLGGSLASTVGVVAAIFAVSFLFRKIRAENENSALDKAISELNSYLNVNAKSR